ncbi:MAG TPA: hypothetical protein VFF30_08320 [Nitrososphaerales archaeon]|nr:hypothetical protein [Nitrososphaerales archaeon]
MNGLYIMIGAILVVVVVLVSLLLFGMRGRGRLIECPECGARFKRSAFAEKSVGFGPGLPGIGDYTCPKCKHRANTSSFRYVDDGKQSNPSVK